MATLVKERYGFYGANDYLVEVDDQYVGWLARDYNGRTRQFPNHPYLWIFTPKLSGWHIQFYTSFKEARTAVETWTATEHPATTNLPA